jgi:ABC-2 type transport system permease protein
MRIGAIVLRIARQFLHDKRTLALMLIVPLFILSLLYLVFKGGTYEPKIAAVNVPSTFVQKLEANGAHVKTVDAVTAQQQLERTEIDAIVQFDGTTPKVKLEGSDPAVNKSVLLLLQKTIESALPTSMQMPKPEIAYLHGSEDMASFDNFGPVLVGFFIFFFVFVISGISFLRERTGGTLERLMASPLRHYEIVLGYMLGFGIFTVIQVGLVAWYTTQVLDILMVGSFWLLLLVMLLLAWTALTLGTLLSTFASSEFQILQFIPVVIVPQVFFSGLFNLDTMSPNLRGISYIMPLSYGAGALRDIMIRGKGWDGIWLNVLILAGFSIVFMLLNLLALRKHRKI